MDGKRRLDAEEGLEGALVEVKRPRHDALATIPGAAGGVLAKPVRCVHGTDG